MSELNALVRAAAGGAGRPLVSDRQTSSTLVEVLDTAESLGVRINARASRREPVVLARVPASVRAVELLLAAVAGGFTICFVDPGASRERTQALEDSLDPDVVVDGDTIVDRRPSSAGPPVPGYVATSSGSTGGPPKGVLSTWGCMAAFAPHGAAALRVGPGDRLAEPSHPAYDLAMTNWLLTLTSGASLAVSDSLGDRMRPLTFVARAEATHVRLAPRFIDLALADRRRTPRSHVLRVWGSGGDRLSDSQARAVFGLGVTSVVNTYGTSETGGFASAAAFDAADAVTSRHGSVSIGTGRVGPWQAELVAEPWGGDAEVDMLAIRAPHLRSGYLMGAPVGEPGGDAVYPRFEAGRVVTGDLGCAIGDELVCLGRTGRLVKRSGVFVNLDDVDRVLRETAGVDAVTVAIRSGELVTLVAPGGPAHQLDDRRMDEVVATHMSPDARPDVLVPVLRVPRLANGKTDQAGALRMAERAAAGS